MKKIWICILMLALLSGTGCGLTHRGEERRDPVEYTVLAPEALPPQVEEVIRQQGEKEFRMTYKNDGYLYLLRGYGRQKTGGFSIQVEELSRTESALYFRTRLLGPETKEEQKGEGSVPYLVVKTEDPGVPVIFE